MTQSQPRKGGGSYHALDPKVAAAEERMRRANQRDRWQRDHRAALAPTLAPPPLSRASRLARFAAVVAVAAWLALVLGYCAAQTFQTTVAPSQIGTASGQPARPAGAPFTLWAWDGVGWLSIGTYSALTACRADALTVEALPPAMRTRLDLWNAQGAAMCAPDGHVPNAFEKHSSGRAVKSWSRLEARI